MMTARQRSQRYREKHRDTINKRNRERRANDEVYRSTLNKKIRAWRAANKEIINRKERERLTNPIIKMIKRKQCRDWYARNKDQERERQQRKRKRRSREEWNKIMRNWRANHPTGRVAGCIRAQVRKVMLGQTKKCKTFDTLGYTPEQLCLHLESLFAPGMSWDNYGKWHIDHRRPVASFNFKDPNAIHECWALSNLQPLWAIDNLSKHAKLDQSFLSSRCANN